MSEDISGLVDDRRGPDAQAVMLLLLTGCEEL